MTNNSFPSSCRCATLEFDLELGTIVGVHGETQRLSPINLKLLGYLLKHHGQVVSRTDLFDAIWPNQLVSDDVLTRAVSDIRTQLAKLDTGTKFIETLPKRGYRWLLDAHPLDTVDASKSSTVQVQAEPVCQSDIIARSLKRLSFHLLLAFILALIFMWTIAQSGDVAATRIAVMPAEVARPAIEPLAQAVDEALLNVLRKNTKVKLLSASAIKSRPQNPFPYFAKEFGASWVIESRVTELDGLDNIELSLVDAFTGLELRNIKFQVANRADIFNKVAQKLEFDLLVDYLSH